MSKISVRMIKGEDFEGELPDDATVYIHNTVTEATVDLQVGIATKLQRGKAIPSQLALPETTLTLP